MKAQGNNVRGSLRLSLRNRLLVVVCSALTVAVVVRCGPPISEDAAVRVAEDRLRHFCDAFQIDTTLLEGPRRIRDNDPGYVFEWVAFRHADPVRVEIWVSESGRAEVGPGVGIERLEGTRRPREGVSP